MTNDPIAHRWQPIETAPKGPQVLVFDEGAILIALWVNDPDIGIGWWDNGIMEPPPTHWMPLPEPPPQEGTEMTHDPIAHWLQSHSCIEEHGRLRTKWAPVVDLYFEPEGSHWAAFVGSAEVPQRMRIGTCKTLADVQQLFETIRKLNAQTIAA